jgi:DNA polymerase
MCGLHHGRTSAVPGEGPADARIVFIGEGPGYHEDRQGRPFVGPAGQFLNELLALAGLQRDDVFIGNVIKCRPPRNRDPLPEEIETCTTAYLFRQIEAINPPVIVTLGRFSMSLFLPGKKISAIHGQAFHIQGRLLVPMIHPAAALHQQKYRAQIEEDFRRLPAILQQAEEAAAHQAEEPPPDAGSNTNDDPPPMEQLSMF